MLKIDKLYKNFGNKEVLKGLDLEIQDGSIFGLVGINGAGKSTLLASLLGSMSLNRDVFCSMTVIHMMIQRSVKKLHLFLTNNSTQLAQQSNL